MEQVVRRCIEGYRFDSWWGYQDFWLTQSFQLDCGPGIDLASNRNQYQEYPWEVKADSA